MKRSFVIIVFFIISSLTSLGQIPNQGFEQWSSGEPVGWFTGNIPGFAVPITQSSTARTGSLALRGEVLDFMGNSYPPFILSGTGGAGFPVTQRHEALAEYYQFTPVGGDWLAVIVLMFRQGVAIGAGGLTIENAAATYTAFNVPVEYSTGEVPDTCIIEIVIVNSDTSDNVHVGSSMLIDDLSFTAVTGVHAVGIVPGQFMLHQNYPNPFNPVTVIGYQLPVSGYTRLAVYDLLGHEVALLAAEHKQAGNYRVMWDATGFPSGMFYCRLEVGGMIQSRKLLLLK